MPLQSNANIESPLYSSRYWLLREKSARFKIRKNTKISTNQETLDLIESELKALKINLDNEESLTEIAIYSASPRVRFLLEKRRYFKIKQQAHIEPIVDDSAKEEIVTQSTLAATFNIGKKLIDVVDDVWSAMKSLLSEETIELVGSYLIGSIGAVIHAKEGYEGIKEFNEAYHNEKIGQRKTRLIASTLTIMFAGAGIGLGGSLIAVGIGASLAGAALFPALICGLLTTIYFVGLLKRSYILNQAIEAEQNAKRDLDEYLQNEYPQDQARSNELTLEIHSLEARKKHYEDNGINQILCKRENQEHLSFEEYQSLTSYSHISRQLAAKQTEYATLTNKKERLEQCYRRQQSERLVAEREVAFATLEVAASALVLIGTILGTAALIGASIASFGIAPLAIIVTGVVIGVVSKFLENKDEKNQHSYSRSIRNWFCNLWDKVTADNSKKPITHNPTQYINLTNRSTATAITAFHQNTVQQPNAPTALTPPAAPSRPLWGTPKSARTPLLDQSYQSPSVTKTP